MGKRLSIIIPVYNCRYVGQAIESIPKSDFIEMIVVDKIDSFVYYNKCA